jgi:ElaA protein
MTPAEPPIHTAAFADLDGATLYELLRLRVDVFVVEQACPYPELDGRDREPTALHCWIEDGGVPVAALRILRETDGTARIGRVVTAAPARHQGRAAALVRHAVALTAPAPVVLGAQRHLEDWYRSLGFEVDGPAYVEDGIPHVPMRLRRAAAPSQSV